MQSPLVPAILGWWLVATLAIITVVDVIALVSGRHDDTVSRWFYNMGRVHPWIYLLIGITLGHILFPLLISNGSNP